MAFDEYLEALELQKANKDLAAEKLARSIGGDKATAPILSSLEKILRRGTLIHDAVMGAIFAEERKRRRSK